MVKDENQSNCELRTQNVIVTNHNNSSNNSTNNIDNANNNSTNSTEGINIESDEKTKEESSVDVQTTAVLEQVNDGINRNNAEEAPSTD